MAKFLVDFEKGAFEQNSPESQRQIVGKRIHDAAVDLKLLDKADPLPDNLKVELVVNSKTIGFQVELPSKLDR